MDHIRTYECNSTFVLTLRRQCVQNQKRTPRAARGRNFRSALGGCLHTTQCTCKYGFDRHDSIDFSTKHVDAVTYRCKYDVSPETLDTEIMLASMVKQWITRYLSHLKSSLGGCDQSSCSGSSSLAQSKSGPTCLQVTPARGHAFSSDTSQDSSGVEGLGSEGRERWSASVVLHSSALLREARLAALQTQNK